jgi:molybdopterin synthase sulfur carrier subunit
VAIKVLYFASLKEALGQGQEDVALPDPVVTVGALCIHLAGRGGEWNRFVTSRNLRCAVNQEMAALDTPIQDGDEVAFFPPVTGG